VIPLSVIISLFAPQSEWQRRGVEETQLSEDPKENKVMWKHILPGLLKDMMAWVVLLNTGTSVSGSLPVADL
jgi:hypothetical protein